MLIVFVLDTSAPAAPYVNQMFVGLSRFIVDINNDNMAKHALDMAIIKFSDSFIALEDLPDIKNPNPAQPIAGGGANYTAPIKEAIRLTDEHTRSHAQVYKPWVIMLTSSPPDDDISAVAADIIAQQNAGKFRFMALGVDGQNSDALKQLTDVVFRQKGDDFTSFFEWIGQCIKIILRGTPTEKPQLPHLSGNVYRDK